MKSQFQRQNKYSCRYLAIVLVIYFGILSFGGCGKNSSVSDGKEGHFKAAGASRTIRILSGSENRELESVLKECSQKTKVNIDITYKGSVDIWSWSSEGTVPIFRLCP